MMKTLMTVASLAGTLGVAAPAFADWYQPAPAPAYGTPVEQPGYAYGYGYGNYYGNYYGNNYGDDDCDRRQAWRRHEAWEHGRRWRHFEHERREHGWGW